MVAPTKVLKKSPCLLGLPEMLTGARMRYSQLKRYVALQKEFVPRLT